MAGVKKILHQFSFSDLFIFFTFVSIFVFRGIFVFSKNFPLNDGGMFYSTVEDVLTYWPSIPTVLSYNNQQIPFAYPPLAFFVTAFLHKLTRIPLIHFFHYLPYLVSSFSVIFFYYFCLLFTKKRNISLLSTWIFGLTPISYEWMIMGGGLTRSFGVLFTLLAFCTYFLWYRTSEKRYLWLLGVFWGLTGLSHLQWLMFCSYSLAILSFFNHKRIETPDFFRVVFLTALILLPWLVFVTWHHGLSPYTFAFRTNTDARQILTLRKIFDEQFFPIVALLGVISLVVAVIRKKYLFPVWSILIVVFNPRGLGQHLIVPFALAVATFSDFLLLNIKTVVQKDNFNASKKVFRIFLFHFFLTLIVFAFGNIFYGYRMKDLEYRSLSNTNRQAMKWVRLHTDANDTFWVVSPYRQWFIDHTSEWFPAIAKRESLLTVQGLEWTPRFTAALDMNVDLQRCADLQCAQTQLEKNQISYSNIYLVRSKEYYFSEYPQRIYDEISGSKTHQKVFENDEISVWKKIAGGS